MLTEQEFRLQSDAALDHLQRALFPLADAEGFEVELGNGVLTLVFEEHGHAKFIVSPYAPYRQIWVSAMAQSYKLSWSDEAGTFVLENETLQTVIERLIRTFLSKQN
jgi:CyaY protein